MAAEPAPGARDRFGWIERVIGGDLHVAGALGRLVTKDEAAALVSMPQNGLM
jgi:hypothetical protein